MTPIVGFSPDLEATTSGVIVDCDQFIPYESGMEAAPGPQNATDAPALAAQCLGAVVVEKLDGTRRVFAGTATKLYELSGGAWLDRSAAVYAGGADTRWMFAQFGDTTIAANRADALQSSASGAFAAISGAPRAQIVFTVGSFVMALNTNDGAEKTNGWHCCASFDAADWTPAVSTQCARGLLVATPGAITAGARVADYAAAFKLRSTYIGQYVGAPSVWDWVQISGDVGCVGKEAVTDIGGALFFVGEDDFYILDGTQPVAVGGNVRQWFVDNSDGANLYKAKCVFDHQRNLVWVFYPSKGSTVCDSTLVYHLKTKQWGRANRQVEAVLNYVATGMEIDDLSTVASTIDALPPTPFDSPFWLSGSQSLSIFDTSHQLQNMTAAPPASSFTTGDLGDDDAVTLLQQMRLRFAAGRGPTTASCTFYRKMNSGDAFSVGRTGQINDGKFDVLQSARWHRAVVNMTGSARVTGIGSRLVKAGAR